MIYHFIKGNIRAAKVFCSTKQLYCSIVLLCQQNIFFNIDLGNHFKYNFLFFFHCSISFSYLHFLFFNADHVNSFSHGWPEIPCLLDEGMDKLKRTGLNALTLLKEKMHHWQIKNKSQCLIYFNGSKYTKAETFCFTLSSDYLKQVILNTANSLKDNMHHCQFKIRTLVKKSWFDWCIVAYYTKAKTHN